MVATRNHPTEFQSPTTDSPTKRVTRLSSATASPPTTPTRLRSGASSLSNSSAGARSGWSHTPSNLTLIWLVASLPLVVWDTGYVLLRPLSMPGGALHAPLWSPYALYGEVDYMYGWKAFNARNGWTAAQGSVNAIETVGYLVYLYLAYTYGQQDTVQGRGAPDQQALGPLRALGESRTIHGREATWMVMLGYSMALLTFSKTVLYWLIEVFSGFDNIGHNSVGSLIFLWIIPNGLWLVFPAYMMYVLGQEILQGLELAAEGSKKSN